MQNKKIRLNAYSKKKYRKSKVNKTENLSQYLKLLFFTCLSTSLSIFLFNNGWAQITENEVEIQAAKNLNKEEILKASNISFPISLLEINPKQIESNIIRDLSLKSVSINRQIFPSKLTINVLARAPIAYGRRIAASKNEKGLIDKQGIWIPSKVFNKTEPPELNLFIEGWSRSNKRIISYLIENRKNLGSPLKKIILNPNGDISLKTKDFELVHLGSNKNLLNLQIRTLAHLSQSLPSKLLKQQGTVMDLRDPSKPELQTATTK